MFTQQDDKLVEFIRVFEIFIAISSSTAKTSETATTTAAATIADSNPTSGFRLYHRDRFGYNKKFGKVNFSFKLESGSFSSSSLEI